MPAKKNPRTAIIDKVSDAVMKAVAGLPAYSGDRLNFLADVIAALVLGYLWYTGVLPRDQVLASFALLLVFLLLCFIATQLMKLVPRSQ